jgi:hypothetical protein
LFRLRDHAKAKLADLDEEELGSIASAGRRIASSLDVEGARLTVSLTDDRERHSGLATDRQAEAEKLVRQARRTLSPRDRWQARADAAEKAAQAEEHRCLAGQAHEQLGELGRTGRHLYPWFERHQEAVGRGLAAELALGAAHGAVYHLLGAPGIASLTAACLTSDRAIDIGRLERLVSESADARQRLLFEVAAELYDRPQGVSLSDLLHELDGEDLDGCSKPSRC